MTHVMENLRTYAFGCRLRAALGPHVVAAMATTEAADLGHDEGNFQR